MTRIDMKITIRQLRQLIAEEVDTVDSGGSFSELDNEIEETKRRIVIRKEITATKEQIVKLDYEILKLEKEKQRLKTENRKRIAALKSPADKAESARLAAETRADNKRIAAQRDAERTAEKKLDADRAAAGKLPMDGYQIKDYDILGKYYDDKGDGAGPSYKLKPKFYDAVVPHTLKEYRTRSNSYSR